MKSVKMVLVGALALASAWFAQAVQVSYLEPVRDSGFNVLPDSDGKVRFVTNTVECKEYAGVTLSSTTLSTGWYVITGEVTIFPTLKIDGDVNIILRNGARLIVDGSGTKHAGLQVENSNRLRIYAQTTDELLMGKLDASGGKYSAGIGSSSVDGVPSGYIEINGGKITATGGHYGAGIGGGKRGAGQNIRINGGIVNAHGGRKSAGIGGGEEGAGDGIEINGGTVTATTTSSGAGIGGGKFGAGRHITINGGTVTATGSERLPIRDLFSAMYSGPGIGGYPAQSIYINGGTVTAYGRRTTGTSYGSAGIGGGTDSVVDDIRISGGTVTAIGSRLGAGIGGCGHESIGSIRISGGIVKANGGEGATGIGGGITGDVREIAISGGKITATGRGHSDDDVLSAPAGIGAGCMGDCHNITISGGTIVAKGGTANYRGAAYPAFDIGAGMGLDGSVHRIEISGGSINCLTEGMRMGCTAVTPSGKQIPARTTVTGLTEAHEWISGIPGYGTKDLYPDEDGKLYFYLPSGKYNFISSTKKYSGNGCNTINPSGEYYGVAVNGTELSNGPGKNAGWTFSGGVLTLSQARDYTLSGMDRGGRVRVEVTANASVTLDNLSLPIARLNASGITFTSGATDAKLKLVGNSTVHSHDGYDAIALASGAKVTVSGDGTIAGAKAVDSRGISVASGASLVMEGGTIRGYYAKGNGGGVYCDGTLTMNGGSIVNCQSAASGGGIYFAINGNGELNKGKIAGCSAGNGGAFTLAGNGTVNIRDYMMIADTGASGAGVCLVQNAFEGTGTLNVWGGTVTNSSASSRAVLAASTGADVKVYGCVFTDNACQTCEKTNGGALLIHGGMFSSAPSSSLIDIGYAATQVGSFYVVGKDISQENGKLVGGTYSFCATNAEYRAAVPLKPYYIAEAQGTLPFETYIVKLGDTRVKVNGVPLVDGSGEGWKFVGSTLTLSSATNYTVTGLGQASFYIDVTENAEVTLKDLRDLAIDPAREIIRIAAADVKIVLDGDNEIYADDGNSAIAVVSGAKLTMSGDGTIHGQLRDKGINGRCVEVAKGGEFVMDGGEISEYHIDGDGGAILNKGTVTINDGGLFNDSAYRGGAIYNAGTVWIWNGRFAYNVASGGEGAEDSRGGFCFGATGSQTYIYGGRFSRNTALAGHRIYSSQNAEPNGLLYGGIYAANPVSTDQSSGGLVLQGNAGVGMIYEDESYIVGTDVAVEDHKLTGGTFTFDITGDTYQRGGASVAQYRTVEVQETSPVTYRVNLLPTSFTVNGRDVCEEIGEDWSFNAQSGLLTLSAAREYVLSGNCPLAGTGVKVEAAATVILSNATIVSSVRSPLEVNVKGVKVLLAGDNTLTATADFAGLQCTNGTSVAIGRVDGAEWDTAVRLTATGGSNAAGIGGNLRSCGDITIEGGTVVAQGGHQSAGIGSGWYTAGGSVTITGGVVSATGGKFGAGIGGGLYSSGVSVSITGGRVIANSGYGAAGIGGGDRNSAGSVAIDGGTVVATAMRSTDKDGFPYFGDDIGNGARVQDDDCQVMITGGSVAAGKVRNPKNANGDLVYSVTVPDVVQAGPLALSGPQYINEYGQDDLYPVDYALHLWLPNGEYIDLKVGDDTNLYSAEVSGLATVAYRKTLDLYVNDIKVDQYDHEADGWSYNGSVLALHGTTNYVISGMATDGSVRIAIPLSCDVAFSGLLGNDDMAEGENLIVIGNGIAECTVNMTFSSSAAFRTSNDVAPIGVAAKATLNLVGDGKVFNWNVDLRGEGEDRGKVTMEDPSTMAFVSREDAESAAAVVKPRADETDFPDIDQDEYAKLFKVRVVEGSLSGTYVLDYQLNEAASNAVEQTFAEAKETLGEELKDRNPVATFVGVAGLYYGMAGSTDAAGLNEDNARPPAWYPSNGGKMQVDGAVFQDSDKAFYQLKASPRP